MAAHREFWHPWRGASEPRRDFPVVVLPCCPRTTTGYFLAPLAGCGRAPARLSGGRSALSPQNDHRLLSDNPWGCCQSLAPWLQRAWRSKSRPRPQAAKTLRPDTNFSEEPKMLRKTLVAQGIFLARRIPTAWIQLSPLGRKFGDVFCAQAARPRAMRWAAATRKWPEPQALSQTLRLRTAPAANSE